MVSVLRPRSNTRWSGIKKVFSDVIIVGEVENVGCSIFTTCGQSIPCCTANFLIFCFARFAPSWWVLHIIGLFRRTQGRLQGGGRGAEAWTPIIIQLSLPSAPNIFTTFLHRWRTYGGGGGLGYGWGSGKSGIWVKSFLYWSFSKKSYRPANSHEDPNLTMHWHRQMGNVAQW